VTTNPPHFDQWRSAEAAAHAAERQVFEQAMRFLDGQAEAPSQAQWERCKELRRVANDLFALTVPTALRQRPDPSALSSRN
jgi:hypothetical protein